MTEMTRLQQLLAYYENGAATIRRAIALLAEFPPGGRRGGRGRAPASGGAPAVFDAAVALDAARRRRAGEPEPPAPPRVRGAHSAMIRANRKRTGALLARFARARSPIPTSTLRQADARRIAVLLRWGLIARKGDGYVRTEKPFSVQKVPRGKPTR